MELGRSGIAWNPAIAQRSISPEVSSTCIKWEAKELSRQPLISALSGVSPTAWNHAEAGKEEWIYKINGLRWSGVVLFVVVIPLPAMIPIGSQYVSFLIHDGQIERATRRDWAFKGGVYCGFFGMMYGGWDCGIGTFEEKEGISSRFLESITSYQGREHIPNVVLVSLVKS